MSETATTENNIPLNVSDAWRTKFEILEKIGADEQSIYKAMSSVEYKGLSFKEKQKVNFNILAFFLGPFYYFSKKMWAKGAVILAAIWVLAALLILVEVVVGASLPDVLYWIPSAVICAQLANYDYFRHVTHGEKMWRGMPDFLSKPIGAIGFPLVALVLLLGMLTLSPAYTEETKSQMMADISGVWRGDLDGAMITIDLSGKTKVLNINGMQFPVTVKSIDQDNHIITLGVNMANGQQVFWTLRQLFDEEGHFTLQMTLHNGIQDGLSFVRKL